METLLIENMCFRRFTSKVCLFLPLYTESTSIKILTHECSKMLALSDVTEYTYVNGSSEYLGHLYTHIYVMKGQQGKVVYLQHVELLRKEK